ncbi:formimidoylglutamase [Legionella spiritensis]|uniref:formimidoylglutamase n=1 Tax=Legionella spiritensis TaxID=452 RepID=UPI000F6E87C4|nr:formimidoylglutamase [Legionella spiritensis]VEG92417.1 formimidoylglutamase [Legionella spiritensis]
MLPNIRNYEPPDSLLWQGRKDSLPGERFFQQIRCVDLRSQSLESHKSGTVMLGFASDEGIRRNEGRPGARSGPNAFRRQFAKLACHNAVNLVDAGNIACTDEQLEQAQEQLASTIRICHEQGYKTMVIGGGHEVAWGHFSGLAQQYSRLGIINFDAHFDLRPVMKENYGTSGTPFWQIAQYCQKNHTSFDYCCLGIQKIANTQSLFSIANEYKVSYLTAGQIHQSSFAWQTAFLDEFLLNHETIFLSVCLDVFAESFAPGVSAPQSLGLTPWQVLPLLKYIIQTGKVISIEIAELSPPLDNEQKTARLAAMIAAELLEFN